MIKVLVFGGRRYDNGQHVFSELDKLHAERGIACIIHGDAHGADELGAQWAVARGVFAWPFPADWDNVIVKGAVIKYRPDGRPFNVLAGHWRNQQMIDVGQPDAAVGFAGGNGTIDMVKRLRAAGIEPIDAGFSLSGKI